MSTITDTAELAALRAENHRLAGELDRMASRVRVLAAEAIELKAEIADLKPSAVAFRRSRDFVADKICEHGVRRLGLMFLDPAELAILEANSVEWRECACDVAIAGSEQEAEEAMDKWLNDAPVADREE